VSKRPVRSTFSVVACTLPPLRTRSHSMSRRASCGNIMATCSILSGGMGRPLRAPGGGAEEENEEAGAPEKKK